MNRGMKFTIILSILSLCVLIITIGRLMYKDNPIILEIDDHISEINQLLEGKKYDKAIQTGEKILQKAEKELGSSNIIISKIAYVLGQGYLNRMETADFHKAKTLFGRTLEIREKIFGVTHPEVVDARDMFAKSCYLTGRLTEAEHQIKNVLAIREKTLAPDHPDVYRCRYVLGRIYWGQLRYQEAELLFQQVITTVEKSKGPDHWSLSYYIVDLAALYVTVGRYPEAEEMVRRKLEIEEKMSGPEHRKIAWTLCHLGNISWFQAKYREAERCYRRSLAISEKTLDHSDIIFARNFIGLARIYHAQGKYLEAEKLFKRALAIEVRIMKAGNPYIAHTLNYFANLYSDQNMYSKAKIYCKKALSIKEKAYRPDHPELVESLKNLGNIYRNQGKYSEAEPLLKRALKIGKKLLGPGHPFIAQSLDGLAKLNSSLNEIEKSLHYYKKLQKSRQHFIEYVFSYSSEDQKLKYIKKYPLVDDALLSFAILNHQSMEHQSDKDKVTNAQKVLLETALEMVLTSKAVVVDQISAEKELVYCSHDVGILKKVENLAAVCRDISILTYVLHSKKSGNFENLEVRGRDSSEVARERLKSLYVEKDRIETALSNQCSEFNEELAARRFSVADVSESIPKGSVLWEFIRYRPYEFQAVEDGKSKTGPPRYLAFTLNHKGEITLTDLGIVETIDGLIASARERIGKAREEAYFPLVIQSEKQLNKITGELYSLVFAPLEKHLGDGKEIFISPDGQLNLIPFEILPCPDGQYVIEKYRISYLSSGRDLLKFRKKTETGNRAVVMADPDFDMTPEAHAGRVDKETGETRIAALTEKPCRSASGCLRDRFKPLDQTGEEGRSVLKMLKEKAALDAGYYEGEGALEEDLKGMSHVPAVLHLATHGFFCEDVDLHEMKGFENPLLRCGLALAGANSFWDESGETSPEMEDGILTAFEASGLNLVGTELVTLSACETGVGEVKNGEGVFGLRRAFQHAGARSIVMSLWKVQDRETRALMEGFYRKWLGGQSKREALRGAALEILKAQREQHGAAHPYLWGAFVLLGASD